MENNDKAIENKIGKNNQYELVFDSEHQEPKKEQNNWRERVGENAFRIKMLDLKIGPGIWDKVKIDKDGNVLEVDGKSYEDWNDMQESMKDRPEDPYDYRKYKK